MKQFFHKITSLLMAFVVLFSTMSFVVDMHYCGDTLIDTTIFKEAKTCGMDSYPDNNYRKQNTSNKDCCSDEQITFEGQDELKISFDKLTLDQQLFVASYIYSYIDLFEGLEDNVIPRDYSPPLVVKNIHQLDEVYLI